MALGASNLVASFFRGTLPGFGSITRTRLACRTGATTQLSGLLTGVFVLLTTYFLMGWLYFLPKAILASIICVVVVGLIQEAPHDIAFYVHMSAWTELALMMLTFVLTLFVGVEVSPSFLSFVDEEALAEQKVSSARYPGWRSNLDDHVHQAVSVHADQDSRTSAVHEHVRANRRR